MKLSTLNASLIRAGLFLAWVPIVALAPLFALFAHSILPRVLGNFLFFWPQAALPLYTFHGHPPQVGQQVWPGWWIIYWLVIAVTFSIATARLRPVRAFGVAGIVVALFTIVLNALIAALGFYLEFEGP